MKFDNGESAGFSECVEVLRQTPGVTPLSLPSGQVLVYAGHTPSGLYLALKGSIELTRCDVPGDPAPTILDAKKGVFLFPEYSCMHEPLTFTVTIKRKAELLFIPRSLILGDPQIRKILEAI